jgi:hypothetical protein
LLWRPSPRNASAAAASPRVPLTYTASPLRAPSRQIALPAGMLPIAVSVSASGPRVVSPPTSATPCAFNSASSPVSSGSTKPASRLGIVNASVQ